MIHTLARLLALGLLFGSAMAEAALGNCPSNFPDGLQSPFSGTAASKGVITFEYNSQLLNNPDSVLAAKTVIRNAASSVLTCTSANCTPSTPAAPTQAAPSFPLTSAFTTVLDVPYNTTQSLAGNGSNQYKQINVNTQSQLNINSGGQSFYIEQLTLASSSILRLSPGDYWIGSLTTGYQTQIQLQGSGQVRLFIRDDWTLSASALLNSPGINSAGTANNLYVYSYGSVTLGNLATFSGYLYSAASNGSNGTIALTSPSYAFGALSAENIRLDTASQVTYVAPTGSCSDLRLSWSMSEANWSGTASEIRDISGNALHGQAYNGATTAISTPALPADSSGFGTCRYGQLQNSSSQYAQVADNSLLDLTGSFTVAVWVRPSSRPASGLMTILSKDTNFEFHQKPTGVINWWWQNSSGAAQEFDSTAALPLDTWTHVVIRYVSGDQRIYLNG
ncbi:MAG: LamG domain-containing protein, partial [Pseudomonas sp.]